MKLLLFYTHDFWMKPHQKSLPDAPEATEALASQASVLALIHAQPADAAERDRVVTKAVKNIKWVAGKFAAKRAVLHFFAHLGGESAPPEVARELVERMRQRLEGAGFEVLVTPFGYFTEFRIHVAGESMGKVFVEV